MKMFKILTPLVAIFISVNLNAQVVFDMELSETTSSSKIIPHDDKSSLPDSIIVNGYIANHKKGICGDICAGGTIKLELSEKVEGYPHSYMYIVTGCYHRGDQFRKSFHYWSPSSQEKKKSVITKM